MRFRKHKPYRCPRLRVIPWYENAWKLTKRLGSSLLWIIATVLSGMTRLLTNLSEAGSFPSWDGSESLDEGSRSDWTSTDGDTVEIDDDDLFRGHWDVSSLYYSICHPDHDSSSSD